MTPLRRLITLILFALCLSSFICFLVFAEDETKDVIVSDLNLSKMIGMTEDEAQKAVDKAAKSSKTEFQMTIYIIDGVDGAAHGDAVRLDVIYVSLAMKKDKNGKLVICGVEAGFFSGPRKRVGSFGHLVRHTEYLPNKHWVEE